MSAADLPEWLLWIMILSIGVVPLLSVAAVGWFVKGYTERWGPVHDVDWV